MSVSVCMRYACLCVWCLCMYADIFKFGSHLNKAATQRENMNNK